MDGCADIGGCFELPFLMMEKPKESLIIIVILLLGLGGYQLCQPDRIAPQFKPSVSVPAAPIPAPTVAPVTSNLRLRDKIRNAAIDKAADWLKKK